MAENSSFADTKERNVSQKIYISRTNREWKAIEKRMAEIGRKDLASYIVGRISLLEKQYADDKNGVISSIEKRIQKPIFIKENYLKILGVISLKTGTPVATLIDRLILDPLMLPLD